MLQIPKMITVDQSQVRDVNSLQPARSSWTKPSRSSVDARAATLMRERNAAQTTN